jgi:uncharacterized protein (DUF1015 family)
MSNRPPPTGLRGAAGRRRPDGLVLEPFRGWSFDPSRVLVDDVICPPYDVVEPDEDERLRRGSLYNVVRLVRPKGQPIAPGAPQRTRYEQAADLLRSWQDAGILVRADQPALYVYEQRSPAGARRGVIGALELRDPADGVVVPHEDVFAPAVADRLALMSATDTQLEPILLTTDGMDGLDSWLGAICVTEPDLSARPKDGTEHRIWRVDDPAQIACVGDALRGASALIADGHHRYATYRRLQAQRRAAGLGTGPWDHGLALLVGTAPDALTLGAIHRTVRGATLPAPTALGDEAGQSVGVTALSGVDAADAAALLAVLAEPAASGGGGRRTAESTSMVATDGLRAVRLDCPAMGEGPLDHLAAAVMADRVLPELFGRTDGDRGVDYHHDAVHAVSAARTSSGVTLLLPAPSLREVRSLAEAGVRMPRKSTSFGPKPRSGLVLRGLDS